MATEKFRLLPAYGAPSHWFALPRAVNLARQNDGLPDFFLEFVSDRNSDKPEDSLYGMIRMGLIEEWDRSSAYRVLPPSQVGVTLTPVTFTTGTYWHLECGDCRVTAPFAWEEAQRATIYGRIPTEAAQLVYAALDNGSLTVARAAIECEVAAFLPRVDLTVTFRPADLLSRLAALSPGLPSVPFSRIAAFLEDLPRDLFQWEGNAADLAGKGLALAGRVRHFFGSAAPSCNLSEGPRVALAKRPEAPDVFTWDLRTPLLTGTPVFLEFDPFTSILQAGQRAQVTAFTRIPVFPRDLLTERVVVASGLPRNIVNCNAADLTLMVDKQNSQSGSTSAVSVPLYPEFKCSNPIALSYKRPGPKPYSTRVSVVMDGRPIEMPWREASGDYQYIGRDRLPGKCVSVFATPELLAQATLTVEVPGPPAMTATLCSGMPEASFLLPFVDGGMRMTVSGKDRTGSRPPAVLHVPAESLTLDLSSFPEYAPRMIHIRVRFDGDAASVQLEFQPESGSGTAVLEFSASAPSGTFSYFPANLFRTRYRFRRVLPNQDEATGWSGFLDERDLEIAVANEEARVAAGALEGQRS